jgi:outer membrane protein TolC
METQVRAFFVRRIRRLPGPAVLCIALVFSFSGVACAESGGDKLVLALPEMIRMAIGVSPEMAERRSEAASAKSDLAQAQAGYYPQVDTTALVGPVNDAKRPEVVGSRIIDPSQNYWAIGVFAKLNLTMSQPLYTFGKISHRRDAAEHGVAARQARQIQTGNEIALRVKELYYALVLSRSGIEAAKEAAGFFDEARSHMERLLGLGSTNVVESELYRVDAYRADVVRGRAEAEKGANISYFALQALLGLPPGKEFEPAEKTLAYKPQELDGPDAYVSKALAERPEFKQLEQALAAQKSLVEATTADRYPSFFAALAGSVAGAPGRETLHNPYIPDDFNHTYAGVVTGVNWHFDFGILKARVEKERAEYERLTHTKANAQLNIPIQVVKSYQDVKQWKVAVEAYDKATAASRKWIVAALTSFDMGTGTADDLLRGIERYGQNRGRYLEALFNYNMSIAQLEYAMGVRSW